MNSDPSFSTQIDLPSHLYEDIVTLSNEIAKLKKLNESIQQENLSLEEQLHQKEKILSQYESFVKELQVKIPEIILANYEKSSQIKTQYKSNINTLMAQNKTLVQVLQYKEHDINKLHITEYKLTTENTKLKQQINELKYVNINEKEITNNKKQILINENNILSNEIQSLKNEYNTLLSYKNEIDNRNKELLHVKHQLQKPFNEEASKHIREIEELQRKIKLITYENSQIQRIIQT